MSVTGTMPLAGAASRRGETKTLLVISAAHFVSHFHILMLPPLFIFLKERMDVGFVELGLAITVFNVVSALTQAPMGFVTDKFGSRRLLIAGLCLGGLAFAALGHFLTYPSLLAAAALAGIANSVYHPADYAILSAGISAPRIGRAFSIHTFAGFLGTAAAPSAMLLLTALAGLGPAIVIGGLLGPVAALFVALVPSIGGAPVAASVASRQAPQAARGGSVRAVLTPAILGLTLFFALLSLSTSGISNFGTAALMTGYGQPIGIANGALTAFLLASAFGVLAGGFVADLTQRHGQVAAFGFSLTAALVLLVALVPLPPVLLIAVLGLAGFLSGMISPSRDMMVRAASPPGAAGRVFGIVTTGFNIGGTLGPMLYGWIMDRNAPAWVFGAAVIFMGLTVLQALFGDLTRGFRRWRASRSRQAVSATA